MPNHSDTEPQRLHPASTLCYSCPTVPTTATERSSTVTRNPSAPWIVTPCELPYVKHLDSIAQAYADAPEFDASAVPAWRALAADSVARAALYRMRLVIRETDDPEPYPDAPAMFRDLVRGRFTVTRAHSEHPIWSVETNVAFRICHDIAGHYATGDAGFDWIGENRACGAHFPLLPVVARPALFTECIAQTAFCNHYGYFGPQKVALIGATERQ